MQEAQRAAQYDMSNATQFKFSTVMAATCDEAACTAWCMQGLCPSFAKDMTLSGTRWRCRRASCGSIERSMKFGSFEERFKLLFSKAVRLMYAWASRKSPPAREIRGGGVEVDML
ncbi:hypothetical protein H257_10937 [Aphanomyces astaci]|uniref:Uncharacterized protein n=1 Tax=Aphanomyces astaci TaxID=112090 RepID=W4G4X5_APHAT|nr:hypothetical protein H257_10937 [Aphanomyces astaci]ETV74346.1 hypothetical protein H257_10937 [Aphanomyces astaci]|eukprot:XP_009836004.1 hypothetical protein H257_10937 [Aphanomyces astaci]